MSVFHGQPITLDGRQAGLTNVTWPINRRWMEISIVDYCNLACPNCCTCCDVVRSELAIPLETVQKFVDDLIRLRFVAQKLKITGGECTLHPKFPQIIQEIRRYRDFCVRASRRSRLWMEPCQFVLLTNGKKPVSVPRWMSVNTNHNQDTKIWNIFESMRVAAIDVPGYQYTPEAFRQGCLRATICSGAALCSNGRIYPCLMVYQIERVFGLSLGSRDLESFLKATDTELRSMLGQACRFCGFFKYPRDMVGEGITSQSWSDALCRQQSGVSQHG